MRGNYWSALVPLAESLEKGHCALAATLLYRTLLDSILDRAESRAYRHGADYLRRLGPAFARGFGLAGCRVARALRWRIAAAPRPQVELLGAMQRGSY